MSQATVTHAHVVVHDEEKASELLAKAYGARTEEGMQLGLIEAYFLQETDRLQTDMDNEALLKHCTEQDNAFHTRYAVFKDLRGRGYVVKTALKFGADFRVYDQGIKPGEDHARWIVYPVPEANHLTWHEFSAKNRVAHSTKKRLMIGVVDDEGDVTYYEVRWMRP